MHSRCALFGLFVVSILVPSVRSQSGVTTPPQIPPGDRSFYLNQRVDHPETLSGVWQSSDGSGGAVGIHLELMTMISGDATPPVWAPQAWRSLSLNIFQRKGPEIAHGDENYFSDSVRGGSVRLENGRLQLHFVSTSEDAPSVDLDLLRQADGCWHGRFHRGSFDSVVTLCRPAPGSTIEPSPLVGTWSSGHPGACIHIYQTGPDTFTGWSDSLRIPGQGPHILCSPGPNNLCSPGPQNLYENYGSLANVHLADNREVSLGFGAYNPICCPHPFVGTLSADNATIQGNFPSGFNQAPHAAIFTKTRGDTCVDPAALTRQTLIH